MKGLFFLFIHSIIREIKQLNRIYKLYPQWLKNKSDGSLIPCKTDDDCPFPSACCNDPFFPVEYCCYGWNKRKLKYAYIMEYVKE